MTEQLDNYKKIALEAARIAGGFLAKNYGLKIRAEYNDVTGHCTIDRDREADILYKDFLKERTPEAGFYTEETKWHGERELVWVVDAVDGSSNYRMEIPFFTTQICLLENQIPVVCVILNPFLKQEYVAVKGRGAYLNGNGICVNDVSDMGRSVLIQDKGIAKVDQAAKYLQLLGPHLMTARMFGGSTGMDLAMIASGKAEIAINPKANLYDLVPGVLLVREAGGIVNNLKGRPWTVSDDNLVATNKKLMSKVLEILQNR